MEPTFKPSRLIVQSIDPGLLASMLLQASKPGLDEIVRRRKNPSVALANGQAVEEDIEWSFYDSFSIAANTAFAKQTMFQTPVSGAKTLASTNMKSNGRMANGDRFLLKRIRCFIANDTVPVDVNNILRNCSMLFTVRTKPYFEGVPILVPAGAGLYLTSAAQVGTAPAGTAVAFATSNGSFDPRTGLIFSKGVPISDQEQFQVIINPETAFNTAAAGANPAGVGTTIFVFLDGILSRGVN